MTITRSVIVDHITILFGASKSTGIIFTYYNFQDQSLELDKSENLVRDFIKQLCWQVAVIPQIVFDFYDLYNNDSRNPNIDKLVDILLCITSNFDTIYLVVDGLDECRIQERERFMKFVLEPIMKHKNAKILITSRKEADIVDALEAYSVSLLDIETHNVAVDIESYVHYMVHQRIAERRLKIKNQDLIETIISTLNQNAEGM